MMTPLEFAVWIENQNFAIAISESSWMFPAIEVVHVLALAIVIGSIAMVDLRLLGLSQRDQGVAKLTSEILPWTWLAFLFAVATGLLMFCSTATRYVENLPFLLKMGLLALAGLNMAAFHFTAFRTVGRWDHQLPAPLPARIAGALSLTFWVMILCAGRWIGFV